jgi:iron complex outermembrane receptor protein
MRNNPYLSKLLATTIICGAANIATPAFAQNDQPAAGPAEAQTPDDGEQNVTVTGSRIPQPNLTATSPVTVVNSQDVQATGTTRTEDLINSLPQAFAAQGGNIGNGASGTATLNLRGLGSVRTLVLVNGRRLVPGDPGSSAADINMIPAALIDRVDVLTGGASSVYGADAVAGVVNFVMDNDFEGIRLDTQYSLYQHNNRTRSDVVEALDARGFGFPTGSVADGGTWDANLAIGAAFDDGRGHVTAYVGYRKIEAVLQARRDYSSCNLSANSVAATATLSREFNCGGSGTSATGTFITNVGTFTVGQNRRFDPTTAANVYNFGPLNHFQRPDERYVAGAFAEYEISPALRPYAEFMFMDDRTVAQIAPSGLFIGNTTNINCNNPLLSAQQVSLVCQAAAYNAADASPVDPVPGGGPSYVSGFGNLVGQTPIFGPDPDGAGPLRAPLLGFTGPTVFQNPDGSPYNRGVLYAGRRNVEGGGRQDDLQHVSYRVIAGMRGELSDVWSYDIYYQYGRNNFSQTYLNDFSVTRLRRAIDVIDNPATPGVDPVCRSVVDGTDPNCVPYDIFALNQVTPAALAYLQTPLLSRGVTSETVANASITGNLGGWGMQFPWASNGVGVAFGVEYRKESLEFTPDASFQSGDGAGQGAATLPVNGQFDVREAFAEARIPIVEENFFHELSLELGYRYSDYNVGARSFSTDTYKIAGFFAPIRDVRFRGGYNRAVRAPNIQELFAPQRVVLAGSDDPCDGVPGATAAQCALTGVTAAQYGTIPQNQASQYNGLVGGNPDLEPEVADTWTVGVVLQPSFIPRLAITVDWFDIKVDGAIQPLGFDNILNACLASGDATFCSLIHRDTRGSLWLTDAGFIETTSQNIGGVSTRGLDIGVSYAMDIGSLGGLAFSFQGTWLDELITNTGVDPAGPSDGILDCVGFFGNQCGTPNPEWRHTARISYNHPDGLGVSLRWRYFSSVEVDDASSDPDLAGANTQPGNDRLPAVNYFDLSFSARIGDHYSFRLGVNNLLDKEPPVNGSQVCPPGPCNGNTWAQVYDALGRYIFAGVRLEF